ncbi:MAG: NAD(P)H-binding protein [Rubrivivax sp.]
MADPLHTLLIAGASGLVGRAALDLALAARDCRALHALVRRLPTPSGEDARLHWLRVDFAALPALPAADAALCALGTTIKVAGSQEAFRAVDHDAVLAFARAAHAAGVRRFGVVSALGADTRSSVFYNRVKGEVEQALREVGFDTLVIARPSLLVGDRAALGQPVRSGERLGLALSRPLSPLIPLRWRPIEAATVARALLNSLREGERGTQVLESDRLQTIGST